MLKKDQIIGRHYKILGQLGAGGMGQVFKAQDVNLGREVAIKFLLDDSNNAELAQRFLNEGRVLATLNHRCVINVYASDVDEEQKVPFLVMEFVDGKSLDHYKSEYESNLSLFLHHMMDLLEGIHACHQKGIIHRDLKPQNILINREGQLKILDFGIAKTARKQTRTGVAMGTPHYMAPEQCMGKATISAKSDVYAIGIIFWEFLTGTLPFDIKTEADDPALAIALMHLSTPPPLEELKKNKNGARFAELLNSMLAKKPEDRPEIPTILETIKKETVKITGFQPIITDSQVSPTGFIGEIYKIEGMIGEGGMGKVLKALDTSLNRTVAVKLLNEIASKDETIVERFIKEGQLLATLGHPNVLNIYASSRDKTTGTPFLVMEFVDGVLLTDLKSTLLRDKKKIAPLMLQLFEGIKACHDKGIIHRDLKPSNLMVTREGVLKIFDFGIAKTSTSMTKTGMTVGTPQYMSPEQCTGAKDLSPQSDIYSMGIIFWELIYGETPFQADDQSNPELSVALKHIQGTLPLKALNKDDPFLSLLPLVRRMLDKEPDKRPSLDELIQALEDFTSREMDKETADKATRRKSSKLRTSGIKEIFARQEEAATPFWKNPIVLFGFVALIIGGIGLSNMDFSADKRSSLVKTIKSDIQKADFESASNNLALLEKEKDGSLLAQQFRLVISTEFANRGQSALNRNDKVAAMVQYERAASIDPENTIAVATLEKLKAEAKAQSERETRIAQLISEGNAILEMAKPGSGTEILYQKIASLTEFQVASEAQRLENGLIAKFSQEGDALVASDPGRAMLYFDELKNHFKSMDGLDERINKAKKSIEEEKARLSKKGEISDVARLIEADLERFSGDGDPTTIISNIDRLVSLGEPGAAGRYRRQLAEKFQKGGESLFFSDKVKAMVLLQKAAAIFPDLPGLNEKIKATDEAIQNEKIAAEKAAALEGLNKNIDEAFAKIKPPENPAALLTLIQRLETEFLRSADAASRRKSLFEKYHSQAVSLKSSDPAIALEILQLCQTISTGTASIDQEIKEIQAAAAAQAELLGKTKRAEEVKAAARKLVKNPTGKNAAKLVEFFTELSTLGLTAEVNTLLAQALEEIKGTISRTKSISETKNLLEGALKLFPKDSPKRVGFESESKAILEKKKNEALSEIGKAVDTFKPASGNLKPLVARLKDLKEANETERVKTFALKLRDKYLAAIKPLEEKDPQKAMDLLKALQTVEGMDKDEKVKDKAAALSEALAKVEKPTPTPTPAVTPTEAPTPTAPPESGSEPEEIASELDRMTAPEEVEGNIEKIIALTAALEKAGMKPQAKGYRERAVNSLVDIADENASQGSIDGAKKVYGMALKILPNHPEALKSLAALKGGGPVEPTPSPTPTTAPPIVTPPVHPPTKPPPPSPTPSPTPIAEPPKPSGFFVGGEGGYKTVSEAVDAAPTGAVVKIRPGKYSCQLSLDKKITLEGEGSRDSIVLESSQGSVFTLSGGAVVSNLTIRFTGGSQVDAVKMTGGSPVIKGCTISSSAGASAPDWSGCITVSGGSPTIAGNSITGSKGMGIIVRGGSPNIKGNTISNHQFYGMWFSDGGAGTVSGNTVKNNQKSGIGVKNGAGPTLTANTVTSNGENGVFVYDGGQGSIQGNTINGNKWFGIQAVRGGTPAVSPDNKLAGNGKGETDGMGKK